MKKRKNSLPSNHRLIMGKNCLLEVLKHSPDRVVTIYTAASQDEKEVRSLAQELRKPIQEKRKQELSDLVESDSHQGFVAIVKEKEGQDLKAFLKEAQDREASVLLALDSIYDPHNLGAILRAAECFGVDGVLWSKNRGASLTPAASKVSVGASELVPLIRVSNLVEAVKRCREANYTVVVADIAHDAVSLFNCSFPKHVVLVLGSEGEGVRELLKRQGDYFVSIPMQGKIDSLNVSQATAVLLSHIVAKKGD